MNKRTLLLSLLILPLTLLTVSCDPEPDPEPEPINREYHVDTDEVEGDIIISEDYVPVDWEKTENRIELADTATGKFIIDLDKTTSQEVKPGSLMTFDLDSVIFLRKVVGVQKNGDKVELQTIQGTMDELFAGSCFEIRLGNPDIHSDVEDSVVSLTRAESGNVRPKVIYPSEVRFKDEDGKWVKRPYYVTRLDEGWCHYEKDWQKVIALDREPGIDDDQPDLGVKFNLTINVDYAFAITGDLLQVKGEENYDNEEEALKALERSKAKWKPTFYLNPSLTGKADFFFHLPPYENKKHKSVGGTVVSHTLCVMTAMVGLVPVSIAFAIGFDIDNELTIEGGMDVTTQIDIGLSKPLVAGAYKGSSGWKPFFDIGKPTFKLTFPAISFGAELDDKFALSPRADVQLYGLAGPYAKILPTLHANVGAGAGIDFGSKGTTDDMDWNGAGFDVGWKATVGYVPRWTVGVGASKLLGGGAFESKPKEIRHELNLLTAPNNIVCLNPEAAKVGQLCEMKFKVNALFSYIISSTTFGSWVPVPVMFYTAETRGFTGKDEIREPDDAPDDMTDWLYRCTDWGTGEVTVMWQPTDETSMLSACFFDNKAGIIDEISIKPNTAPSNAKAVDLGCSVLWANMNVGALEDYELGDLVGWGDQKGTEQRQWVKEEYGKYVEGPMNLLDWYGGLHRERGIGHGRYDYATIKWGGEWQMPTKANWDELIQKCKWEWDEQRKAFKVSGNGNHIYLPAVGYKIGEKGEGGFGITCEYWSSSLDTNDFESVTYNGYDYFNLYPEAYYMYAENGAKARTGHTDRCYRQSIRAIYPK